MRVSQVFLYAAVVPALVVSIADANARDGVRQIMGSPQVSSPPAKPAPVSPVAEPESSAQAIPPASDPAPASAQSVDRGALMVAVNRAKVIRLPERAQTVVVGNPAIADLSLQKNGIVIVTGKSYGSTNLIALDGNGAMLAESLVNVVAQTDGLVIVQRAFDRFSYSCNPVCQPSVNLGDTNAYFNDARGQADAHNSFAGSR